MKLYLSKLWSWGAQKEEMHLRFYDDDKKIFSCKINADWECKMPLYMVKKMHKALEKYINAKENVGT